MNFIGAGILITDYKNILCGYQKYINNFNYLNGFGGKKENNESYYETAIREFIEEMYEVTIKKELIIEIIKIIKNIKILINDDYIIIVINFTKLKDIMVFLKDKIKSKLYDKMPNSLEELILNRKIGNNQEIKQISIIPFHYKVLIHPLFNNDIIKLFNS